MIDAYEGQEVTIIDLPGAFLMVDQDEMINTTLRGKLAKLMLKIAQEVYRKYVVIEKGEMVLHEQLLKALYGCLRSALMLYKKLITHIEGSSSTLNTLVL